MTADERNLLLLCAECVRGALQHRLDEMADDPVVQLLYFAAPDLPQVQERERQAQNLRGMLAAIDDTFRRVSQSQMRGDLA